ncbi:acyl-CoA thioesterase [Saccharopolyspora sp. NPDC002686]|uniref:acyl-CoA thioesterase n=1 Tax=Saccharopolyspora sp. NPDC002686 TaxID=3154541 RepID=UPI00332A5F6C
MTTDPGEPTPFRLTIAVRSDDLDVNGHVRGPAYLAYGDHARWACLAAAGVDPERLRTHHGLGPVNLETTIRYHRELLPLSEVEVTCEFHWGQGKTNRVRQELRQPNGPLAAEIRSTSGLLCLTRRRLAENPAHYWRLEATDPRLLNL